MADGTCGLFTVITGNRMNDVGGDPPPTVTIGGVADAGTCYMFHPTKRAEHVTCSKGELIL